MPGTLRIGIVGFGVAGGALAIFLARQGHRVTLIERAPQLGPVGAGFILQPTGQNVLRALGLFDSVRARSAVLLGLNGRSHRGRRLVWLRYPGDPALGVHRGVLFDLLRETVEREHVEIRTAAEIVDVRGAPGSVSAIALDGTGHGPFDFIAACDGSRSRLREILNPTQRRVEYQYGALWGNGRCDAVTEFVEQAAHSTRRLAGLLPIGGGRCTFFWGLHRDELDSIRARPFADWTAEIAALMPEAAQPLADIASHDAMVFAGYIHKFPRHRHDARVVLVGDAAHAMSPQLGQGANLALVDAESLARHLSTAPNPESAFAAYRRERHRQSRYFSLLSRWLGPTFQGRSTFLGWSRDLALPLMCAFPWMRRQMELSLAGEKQGFFARTLRVRERPN